MYISIAKRGEISYLMLINSYRQDGKLQRKSVILGRYDILITINENILEELKDELKQDEEKFLEKYVNQKKLKDIIREHRLQSVNTPRIPHHLSKYYTSKLYDIYREVWNYLQLPEFFNKLSQKHNFKYSINDILYKITTSLFLEDKSLYLRFSEELISIQEFCDIALEDLYAILELLCVNKAELEQHLYNKTIVVYPKPEKSSLLYMEKTITLETRDNYNKIYYELISLTNGMPLISEVRTSPLLKNNQPPKILKDLSEKFKINKLVLFANKNSHKKLGYAKEILHDLEVTAIDKYQKQTKENFKILKDYLKINLHAANSNQIIGQMLICFIALYLERYLENSLTKKSPDMSIFKIREKVMESIAIVRSFDPDYIKKINEKYKDLFEALNKIL